MKNSIGDTDRNPILKHFFVMFIGTGINLFVGVMTTPIITRIIDPEVYGQFSLFKVYVQVGFSIFLVGLDQSFVRFFYRNNAVAYKKYLLFSIIKIPLGLCLFLVIILLIARGFVIKYQSEYFYILSILYAFNVFLLVFNRFSLLALRLQMKTRFYSAAQIIQKILYLSIVLIAYYLVGADQLFVLIISTLLSFAIATALSISMNHQLWDFRLRNKNSYGIKSSELVKYGIPFIFSSFAGWVFAAADKIAISHFGNYGELGVYSAAINIVTLFAVLQTTFSSVWVPMAMEHYERNPHDRTFYQDSNQYITVLMFFFGATIILLKDVFSLLLGEQYRSAAFLFPLLILNPLMTTISETTVYGINFLKKTRMHIVIMVISAGVNIIANYVLVPRFGMKGAAFSTGVSYVLFFSLRTMISNRYFYVDFKLKKFYFVTLLFFIYSIYGTFYETNLILMTMYVAFATVLFLCYKNYIINGLSLLMSFVKDGLANR